MLQTEQLLDITQHITTADIDALRYLKNQIDAIGTFPDDIRHDIMQNLVANVPDVSDETFLLIGEVLFGIVPFAEINDMSNILKMRTVLRDMTGPKRIEFFIDGAIRAMNTVNDRNGAIERALHIFQLYCFARPDEELNDAYEKICALLDCMNYKPPHWKNRFLSETSVVIIDQFYDKMEKVGQ